MSPIIVLAPPVPLVLMLALCALAFIQLVGLPLLAALARTAISVPIVAMLVSTQ
ncbi:hypothetical protein [Cereibacter sphaeroides]|uniref:hypothetical protein n=1 Tax=Cereibacter sphaeroides TaxID=1063 RepID=UPI001559B573|nr:hypothetical protein [Cereibacter sphaeroides]